MNLGIVTDAASVALDLQSLPADQVLDGAPAAGHVKLTDAIGVWEHTPGTSTDVETDEVFVVLSGCATVSFDDPALNPIELRAGSMARLAAGMRTVWTVTETLRKIYIAG
ncbi:cupin domain-containing protein [Microbacterium sp. F51-2R]|uniref:cupin domain-containing protein n=1 Tax=Microbacterium sp. F51-2R TaxID=3445777 RepID=UPI003FA08C15